jgi:hypothetical protein
MSHVPPPEELQRIFAESRRNRCVLNKDEVQRQVRGGYAAALDGRLIAHAPTWEELRTILEEMGLEGQGRRPVEMVIARTGRRFAAPSGNIRLD